MRLFVVLSCLLVAVVARPEPGYSYNVASPNTQESQLLNAPNQGVFQKDNQNRAPDGLSSEYGAPPVQQQQQLNEPSNNFNPRYSEPQQTYGLPNQGINESPEPQQQQQQQLQPQQGELRNPIHYDTPVEYTTQLPQAQEYSDDTYNNFPSGSGYAGSSSGGYPYGPDLETVHKHIYVHVPPKDFEEEEAPAPRVHQQPNQKQKHYKIIFIKAPNAPAYRPPVIPPTPQNEEKTLIYVLHKKPEQPEDIILPTQPPTKPSKPEVYFIKYKTKKEEDSRPVYGPPPTGNVVPNSLYGAPSQQQQLPYSEDNQLPNFGDQTEYSAAGNPLELDQNEPNFVTELPSLQSDDLQNSFNQQQIIPSQNFGSPSSLPSAPIELKANNKYLPPVPLALSGDLQGAQPTNIPSSNYGPPPQYY